MCLLATGSGWARGVHACEVLSALHAWHVLLGQDGVCPEAARLPAQAGGKNEAREVKTPAGLPRLFKSALDWNLYSSLQAAAHDRKVRFSAS